MVNILSKFFSGLKKESTVLGIDIGTSAIKIVELEREGDRAVLKNYGALALGPYAGVSIGEATLLPQDKIVTALGDLLREANLTSRTAVISIPMSTTMISFIELPALDEKKLNTMIPLEARKYIPVPTSEVALDWWIIPHEDDPAVAPAPAQKTPDPKQQAQPPVPAIPVPAKPPVPGQPTPPATPAPIVMSVPEEKKEAKKVEPRKTVDVLIAAIHNETLQSYDEIKTKAGLTVNMFEIEIFSTIRSVAQDEKEPVMIIDIGAGSTKIAMIEHGIIRATHTIRRGSQDVTGTIAKSMGLSKGKAEELKRALGLLGEGEGGLHVKSVASLPLSHIFTEANSVLLQYQKKHNKIVRKVILTGGGSLLKGIETAVKEHIKADIIISNPFSNVEAPVFLEPTLKDAGPEFAVAIGAALKGLQMN